MSTTSRSMRGRCVAVAAITVGVGWLATGPAMASAGVLNHDTPVGSVLDAGRLADQLGLPGLSSAAGVLGVADAAGAEGAAGTVAGKGLAPLPGSRHSSATKVRSALPGLPDAAKPTCVPDLPGIPERPAAPGQPKLHDVSAVAPEVGRLKDKVRGLISDLPKAPELPEAAKLPVIPSLEERPAPPTTSGIEAPALPEVPRADTVADLTKDVLEGTLPR